ncbi:ATP phosphoribosyltransferase (ATP-PRTase) (ATP-PRT) [Ascoidea rubescens DSM 1968]|uniref:ATP phosphoribosyltransferase n=1 Tax=Ascoidea rubescens DSM 1968 TaxID=1344418 RepID=A0A1D2V8E8_9ASCO|nr:ATP phosphoribosyltransferase (ATP-PRTase) (ATP-PRT) [Ascoidea rubescens DSM 1968]ODV57884.1 ATP phosphoribosyltransferase (ATP-PRTase) (ATP-PRT) [Ascoidea rubescens DSM 1968]
MDLLDSLTDRIFFAIPKKGRIHDKCLELLKGADIQFRKIDKRLDIALSTNLPIALVFLRESDIPIFVSKGRCSIGIANSFQIKESIYFNKQGSDELNHLLDLTGYFDMIPKLCLQVPKSSQIRDPKELIGKTITTNFVNITRVYFMKLEGKSSINEISTKVKFVSGSIEASCALGIADGIVDLVDSGSTMTLLNLINLEDLFESIKNEDEIKPGVELITSKKPLFSELVELIKHRIEAVYHINEYCYCNYNCPKTKLDDILKVTPYKKAPKIAPLISAISLENPDDEQWVAVGVLIEKDKSGVIMDVLRENGAEDVFLLDISNCRV